MPTPVGASAVCAFLHSVRDAPAPCTTQDHCSGSRSSLSAYTWRHRTAPDGLHTQGAPSARQPPCCHGLSGCLAQSHPGSAECSHTGHMRTAYRSGRTRRRRCPSQSPRKCGDANPQAWLRPASTRPCVGSALAACFRAAVRLCARGAARIRPNRSPRDRARRPLPGTSPRRPASWLPWPTRRRAPSRALRNT